MSYNIICEDKISTVVAEYITNARSAAEYQSEADLEREFISSLTEQGYKFLSIRNEADLIENLRTQLEVLNNFTFSEAEWKQFFDRCIAKDNEGIVEKTRKIQDDHIQVLRRDDGTTKNVKLIDKGHVHNNRLQVINQYEEDGGTHASRYDVTILVNGFPFVHIELKRRGVEIREAFNQIKRYQRESFWATKGLYEYVQIFVISNGTHTKYYSNTTRNAHIKEQGESERRRSKKTSNSFEFTSYWADASNKPIADLTDFTKTFFAKHTLLNILINYCVFTSEEMLLVMRPYQIVATERILKKIKIATNYKKAGTKEAGGYIWHTTGSGKTLTSFKTAQLAKGLDSIDKVLFVVDRKDLDYQTMKEYDRFEKGAANASKSTKQLEKNLNDPNAKIIITTIQKLDILVSRNKALEVYNKHVVLIFDECHRSQFGEMHKKIVKAFSNYYIFGFTGTPIMPANAAKGKNVEVATTAQLFGGEGEKKDKALHTYTIVNAINDENVLPFRIDFIDTVKQKENIADKDVRAIDVEKAMLADERVDKITAYIIEHFDQKTKRNTSYALKGQRVKGFNSIFAVASIPMAKKYYDEFKKQLSEKNKDLTVATIFSFSANENELDETLEDEGFENEKLDKSSRDFLELAIADYNNKFGTNWDTSADKFQSYYKDLSSRMKNREVDLLIVVNMFLTGFDATTLNTLWVDKNLKQHGLIQAYSRTNRILNSVKTFGNIVCFRDLEQATKEAISLFGDENAGGIVLLKTYEDYYNGFEHNGDYHRGYKELIEELVTAFPLGEVIMSEEAQKDFIKLYGAILRLKNILSSFDKFQNANEQILSDRDFQDYQSVYIDLYQSMRPKLDSDKENINDDIIFELELVKQVEVNIDYILSLVEKYRDSNCEDKEILVAISKAVGSSMEMRSKKELIQGFVESVNISNDVSRSWKGFVETRRESDLTALIAEENLKDEEARRFIEIAFRDGLLKTSGTDVDKIMPAVSRFGGGNRDSKKQRIIAKLSTFFEKYLGLG